MEDIICNCPICGNHTFNVMQYDDDSASGFSLCTGELWYGKCCVCGLQKKKINKSEFEKLKKSEQNTKEMI